MNLTIDLGQGAELRVAGSTVGVFVPEAKLRQLIGERDTLKDELAEARRQISGLTIEIERYEKALTAAVRDQFDVMDEETALAHIADAEKNGVGFSDVIREIDAILYKEGTEGRHAG